jgi:hypothetical protein
MGSPSSRPTNSISTIARIQDIDLFITALAHNLSDSGNTSVSVE